MHFIYVLIPLLLVYKYVLESLITGEVATSIDINPMANIVYKHNFPSTNLLNRNIQSLTSEYINNLNVDTIFMSPPCQPFTRNGLKQDVQDPRSSSFSHLLSLLPNLNVKYILIENVKGFETSEMRGILISTLENCQFSFQEFILSPSQFGVPNNRYRYYCIARKKPCYFNFKTDFLVCDKHFVLLLVLYISFVDGYSTPHV